MPGPDGQFTILVTADVYDKFASRLIGLGEPHFKWIRVDFSRRPGNFPELLERADCVITRTDLTEEEYRWARRLKLLQLPIAGYERVDLERAARHGVAVANSGGANAISVAEHVFMLALALFRHLLFHHKTVVDGSWICLKYENLELAGKTLGIVGLGNVGRAVAARAGGFGMRVLYFDIRRPEPTFEQQYALEWRSFESLMRESDVVTLHVPLTAKTGAMINRQSLSWMKRTSILINTSRGEVVDEAALVGALGKRHLLGAGLDVFREEPVPRTSPLLTLDNVVLSPHAGPSYESQFRMVEHVAANVVRVARGQPPLYAVIDYDAAHNKQTRQPFASEDGSPDEGTR